LGRALDFFVVSFVAIALQDAMRSKKARAVPHSKQGSKANGTGPVKPRQERIRTAS
jgi:hypothetical protein